jgi:hypothetical protein
MNQVLANGVSPVLTTAFRWVGLIEKVPFLAPIAQAVWVIHAALRGNKMIGWAGRISEEFPSRGNKPRAQGVALELMILLSEGAENRLGADDTIRRGLRPNHGIPFLHIKPWSSQISKGLLR